MDAALIQQHLAQAERHAAEGRRLVVRQEALVANLCERGRSAADACKVLEALKEATAVHDLDVERLHRELRAASQGLPDNDRTKPQRDMRHSQ
jgi:hypothetical protein